MHSIAITIPQYAKILFTYLAYAYNNTTLIYDNN